VTRRPRSVTTLHLCFAVSLWMLASLAPARVHGQVRPDSSGYVTTADGARLYYAIFGRARDTVIVPGGMLLTQELSILRENATLVFYDPRAEDNPTGSPTRSA
jgi:hypothetical protein